MTPNTSSLSAVLQSILTHSGNASHITVTAQFHCQHDASQDACSNLQGFNAILEHLYLSVIIKQCNHLHNTISIHLSFVFTAYRSGAGARRAWDTPRAGHQSITLCGCFLDCGRNHREIPCRNWEDMQSSPRKDPRPGTGPRTFFMWRTGKSANLHNTEPSLWSDISNLEN